MKSDTDYVTITIPGKIVAPLLAARSSLQNLLSQSIVSVLMILLGLILLAFSLFSG